jgi:hypothetical protein
VLILFAGWFLCGRQCFNDNQKDAADSVFRGGAVGRAEIANGAVCDPIRPRRRRATGSCAAVVTKNPTPSGSHEDVGQVFQSGDWTPARRACREAGPCPSPVKMHASAEPP